MALTTINISTIYTEKHLSWMAALLGMTFCSIVIYLNYGIVSSDGILYIEVAKQIATGNWNAAFSLYRWPFYPSLISLVHLVSGWDFQLSAHFLTIVFFGLTASGLAILVRELGGGKHEISASAVLFLSSPYIMESMPPMIIRDHGLGCFHVWSLVFFLRFYQHKKFKDALLWGATALLAMLFRIEAFTYMILLPLVLLLKKEDLKTRYLSLLQANIFLLVLTITTTLFLALNPGITLHDLSRLGDPARVAQAVWDQLQQGLSGKADIYADKVLGKFLDDYALIGLVLTLSLVLISQTVTSAGWVALIGAAYAAKNRIQLVAFKRANIMHWLLLLGIINAAFILLSVFVLSSRYVLPVSLVIIVYASFGMTAIFKVFCWPLKAHNLRGRGSLALVIVVGMLLQTCYIFWPPNPESHYEIQAANWLISHTPQGSSIYFDQGRLRYYYDGNSQSRGVDSWSSVVEKLSDGPVHGYDYAVVHVSDKHPEQEQYLVQQLGQPLASFKNRQKKVVIFSIRDIK